MGCGLNQACMMSRLSRRKAARLLFFLCLQLRGAENMCELIHQHIFYAASSVRMACLDKAALLSIKDEDVGSHILMAYAGQPKLTSSYHSPLAACATT